ncbi:hypothetical protein BDV18DRAFT_162948 [Aspergillus unguis]
MSFREMSTESQDPDLEGNASDQEASTEKPTEKPTANVNPKPQKSLLEDPDMPEGPWGNRGVTSRRTGTKRPPEKDSSLNVRINLDLRADVALELHAVLQGDVTIGLF